MRELVALAALVLLLSLTLAVIVLCVIWSAD